MERLGARLAWCGATVLVAALATARVWQSEVGSCRYSMHDPYYLGVLAFTPVVFVAWLGAGSILLARIIHYRGIWYFLPQLFAMLLMIVKVAGLWLEAQFLLPCQDAIPGQLELTGLRAGLLALGVATYCGAFVSATVCLWVCLRAPRKAEGASGAAA